MRAYEHEPLNALRDEKNRYRLPSRMPHADPAPAVVSAAVHDQRGGTERPDARRTLGSHRRHVLLRRTDGSLQKPDGRRERPFRGILFRCRHPARRAGRLELPASRTEILRKYRMVQTGFRLHALARQTTVPLFRSFELPDRCLPQWGKTRFARRRIHAVPVRNQRQGTSRAQFHRGRRR